MTALKGRFRETGAVHVWFGRSRDRPEPSDVSLLDEDELRVAEGRSGPHAAYYVGAHAAVRRVLGGHYLGVPPADVRFGRHVCPRCGDPLHGRPRILAPATALDFNLSRSGPYWLVAVTAGTSVGVDVEQRTGAGRAPGIALTPRERTRMRRLEPCRRQELFLTAWTRKEAVLKACGVGIVADLGGLEVSPEQAGPVLVEHAQADPAGRWHVQDLVLAPGLHGALAQDAGNVRPVVMRRYEGLLAGRGGDGV